MLKADVVPEIKRLSEAMSSPLGAIGLDAFVELVMGVKGVTPRAVRDAVDDIISAETRMPKPATLKEHIRKHIPRVTHTRPVGMPPRSGKLMQLGREANRLAKEGHRVVWVHSNGRRTLLALGDEDQATKVISVATGSVSDEAEPGTLPKSPVRGARRSGKRAIDDPCGHTHVRGTPAEETCLPCWRMSRMQEMDRGAVAADEAASAPTQQEF